MDIVWDAVFSPSRQLVATASESENITIWDISSGAKEPRNLIAKGMYTTIAVVFSPDGTLVAGAGTERQSHAPVVTIWNTASGMERTTLRGHDGRVQSVPFSPDGRLVATASDDGTARLWDWNAC